MEDLESIYDAEISPLMKQILEICKKHKMPMFAEFQFSDDGFCKSFLKEGHPVFLHLDAISKSREDNGINIDKYVLGVMRVARDEGHSSLVLSQLGLPLKPVTEESE